MNTATNRTPFCLIILDGLALNPNDRGNAVAHAKKETLDALFRETPWSTLITHGERVGLPDDQMGNSEVGHLNLGAGRVVDQELTKIGRAVRERSFGENPVLSSIIRRVAEGSNRALHLIGLASTGGVHSHMEHLKALIDAGVKARLPYVVVHAITDGRDLPPNSAKEEIDQLQSYCTRCSTAGSKVLLSTLCGRYYTMDRDKRWERTKRGYDLMTAGLGEHFPDAATAIQSRYNAGQSDEFIEPVVLTSSALDRSQFIEDGDGVLFFNFRTDRMRQIVPAFLGEQIGFESFERAVRPKLSAIGTLTQYEAGLPVEVIYPPFVIQKHLGEVIAESGLRQLRLAETEKYPHVTYFFNGGNESSYPGEERIMVPSPKEVATYDLKPEMSAEGVTAALISAIEERRFDVAIVNYANCDMVGHTGNFDAARTAVETVDRCLGRVLKALLAAGGSALVTADHGNADQMVDYETGEPHTFHTKYPVPLFLVGAEAQSYQLAPGGALCDVAPTICDWLSIAKPSEMTGSSLLKRR